MSGKLPFFFTFKFLKIVVVVEEEEGGDGIGGGPGREGGIMIEKTKDN